MSKQKTKLVCVGWALMRLNNAQNWKRVFVAPKRREVLVKKYQSIWPYDRLTIKKMYVRI